MSGRSRPKPGAGDHPNPERARLESAGILPRKRLGQNFLLDSELARRVVAKAGWPSPASILEIGPGGGTLTAALLDTGHAVTAVEIDPRLIELLRGRFQHEIEAGLLVLREGDALHLPWETAAREELGAPPWIAGNLPYGITTPLILRALACRDRYAGGVFMVQREYGERLLASPGTKTYSSLTVWTAAHASVRKLLLVGRSAFWPRPGVESVVVELVFPEEPPFSGDRRRLERLLRAAFGQRRKTLENSLAHGLGIAKGRAREALLAAGSDPGARAETLDLTQFTALEATLGPDLDRPLEGGS